MNQRLICVIVVALALGPIVPTAADEKPKSHATPEAAWAGAIALDFWEALLNGDGAMAAGLLSPELTRSLAQPHFKKSADAWLMQLTARHAKATVRLDSEAVAPDRSEVVLKGVLSGREYAQKDGPMITADFMLRVAKESGGRWSIRYLQLKGRPADAKGK
jgi:hypothetical protein